MTPSQADGWRYAVAHMPAGVLRMSDRGVLLVWVEAEGRLAMEMQAKLDQDASLKLVIRTPAGLAPSPYNDFLDETAKTMLRAVQELGFSPAARMRINCPSPSRPTRRGQRCASSRAGKAANACRSKRGGGEDTKGA
jgi:hypothetical protein